MQTDSSLDGEHDDLAEWIPHWNSRWNVLLGMLLVGSAAVLHGATTERVEDVVIGGLLFGLAAYGWYLARRDRHSAATARWGGLLGLWLVTATLFWGVRGSLLMRGSLAIGVLLVVGNALFYNLLKTL